MSSSKGPDFGAPQVGPDTDPGKLLKLAQRVEKTLKDDVVYREPKQLDPRSVVMGLLNRDGAPPNVPHIHHTLLKGILTKGYDRSRPLVGICIEYKSEAGKKKLIEHNQRFSKGSNLLPPIYDDMVLYGSLAGSHLNLALRLIQCGARTPAGDLVSAMDSDEALKDVVTNGHRWWILPEHTEDEKQVDISLWRNQDQNENQRTHEIEIIQGIITTAENLASSQKKVILADLMAKAARRNPAKIAPPVMRVLAQYYTSFLESGDGFLVNELVDWHSTFVNPRELQVGNSFYQTLVGEQALQKAPFTKHYLLLSQYTPEKSVAQAGTASRASFLETSTIVGLVKKAEQLTAVESKIRELRDKYLPILEVHLSPKQARLELSTYIDLIIRCLLAKPWPSSLQKFLKKVHTGKYSSEKIKDLGASWAQSIDEKYPDMQFSSTSGLKSIEDQVEGDEKEVNLEKVGSLKRNASDSMPDQIVPDFARGDMVTVVRKMTWNIPRENQKDYRRDIVEGTEGEIVGWADVDKNTVLLKVKIQMPKDSGSSGGPQWVTHSAYPRNLQLTKDYLIAKASSSAAASGQKEEAKDPATKKSKKDQVPEKVLGDSDPSSVKIEHKWEDLLSDNDKLNKNFWLRSRVGVALESLYETLPEYSDKDLFVVHRTSKQGVPKDELWTKRDFAPQELQFAPLVSQIKETHLTLQSNAVVTLPKHGPGAHPEGSSIALDGRGRTSLAKVGVLDNSEHRGGLFWMVGKTQSASEPNMSLESVGFQQHIELHMPLKKRKASVLWEQKDLPSIPILVNKKTIKEHTRLMVFQAPQKKEEK